VLSLFVVYTLYVGGSPVLAVTAAAGLGLGLFVYTRRGAYHYRYLFPGLAGIALFIVLPVIYTIWISFNQLQLEESADVRARHPRSSWARPTYATT